MSKIKNGELDQYGAEPFKQQQFRTASVEGVNFSTRSASKVLGSVKGNFIMGLNVRSNFGGKLYKTVTDAIHALQTE